MNQISEENSLLDKIIDPIDIGINSSAKQCVKQLHQRNEVVVEWYEKFPHKKTNQLHALKVFFADGEEQEKEQNLVYLSDHEDFDRDFLSILKLFLKESDPLEIYKELIKKHIGEKKNEKYKSYKILNW